MTRAARVACVLAAGSLVACAASPTSEKATAPVASVGPSAPVASVASVASTLPAPVDAGAEDTSADIAEDAGPATLAPFDATAWAVAHGVTGSADFFAAISFCEEVHVGLPSREALVCGTGPVERWSNQGGESVMALTIVEPRHGKLHPLLYIPYTARALDFPESVYVELDHVLSPDGLSFTVSEQPGKGCAEQQAYYREQMKDEAELLSIFRRTIAIACRGRGRYVWRDDHFVRPS